MQDLYGSHTVRSPSDPLEKEGDSESWPCVRIPLVLSLNHIRSYMVEWENQRYQYTWP